MQSKTLTPSCFKGISCCFFCFFCFLFCFLEKKYAGALVFLQREGTYDVLMLLFLVDHAFKTDHNACCTRPAEPAASHARADSLIPTNKDTMVWTITQNQTSCCVPFLLKPRLAQTSPKLSMTTFACRAVKENLAQINAERRFWYVLLFH